MTNQIVPSPTAKTNLATKSASTVDMPSKEEIRAVRGFMATFEKAIKSYSLYPKTHTISKNLLSGLENSLTNFFDISPDLKLDVEKDRVCYKTVEVYRSGGREDYLVTPFFRDGILWIEFGKGTTTVELSFLLGLLNDCRALTDESEGDLVTALWKENLQHINYEAADVFWETEPRLDFSHFHVTGPSEEAPHDTSDLRPGDAAGDPAGGSGDAGKPSTVSIASNEIKRSLMQLTADEQDNLKKLIEDEEHRNRNEDILDMLLIVLEDEAEEAEFGKILELLVQEFENILLHGEFQLAVKILSHLKNLYGTNDALKIWRDPLIDQYFDTISKSEFLETLRAYLPEFKIVEPSRIRIFRQVLLMLRPSAVLALGPLLSEALSTPLRLRLMEAIGVLSKQDLKPLSQLLKAPDDQMVRQLVTVVGHLDGKHPQRLLLDMARHSCLDVRREALKQLLRRAGCVHRSFFFMLEDSSAAIRHEILSRLASERTRISEDSLLEYLHQKVFHVSDFDHILACYIALGKCGSSHSIPFLKTTLENWSWWEMFNIRRSPHRRGAALALSELNLDEADKILQQAARSIFPPLKRAAHGVISGRRSK